MSRASAHIAAIAVPATVSTLAGCSREAPDAAGASEPNLSFVENEDWFGIGLGMQDGNDYATILLGQLCVDGDGSPSATITSVEAEYRSSPEIAVSDFAVANYEQCRSAPAEQSRLADIASYREAPASVESPCGGDAEADGLPSLVVEIANASETDAFVSGLQVTYGDGRTVQSKTVIALCRTTDDCEAPSEDYRGEFTGNGDETRQ